MTEAERLACTDPWPLLEFLRANASDRKGRLIACACCRELLDSFPDDRCRRGVAVAERLADMRATEQEVSAAATELELMEYECQQEESQALSDCHDEEGAYCDCAWCSGPVEKRWRQRNADIDAERGYHLWETFLTVNAMGSFAQAVGSLLGPGGAWQESLVAAHGVAGGIGVPLERRLRDFLRCAFPNPFRPSPPLPPNVLAWNDATVRRIAEGIYEERAFTRLPILADALLDAGCDNEELIQHCRSAGPHVRGCWAVDLILGSG